MYGCRIVKKPGRQDGEQVDLENVGVMVGDTTLDARAKSQNHRIKVLKLHGIDDYLPQSH